jgi:hypothetical protein
MLEIRRTKGNVGWIHDTMWTSVWKLEKFWVQRRCCFVGEGDGIWRTDNTVEWDSI